MNDISTQFIGLIPAAGHATRLKYRLGSKEIYPLTVNTENGEKIFPVCKCLLDVFSEAGINQVCLITRKDKKDIEKKLSNGKDYGVNIKYIYCDDTIGPPYTLDYAYEHIKNKYNVALGFPDILIKPKSSLNAIMQKQKKTNADVVLALIKTDTPQKMDMVVFDRNGYIQDLKIKPKETSLEWTWVFAVWSPKFSTYMHKCLKKLKYEYENSLRTECHVGTIFQLALKDNFKFEHVFIHEGELIDMGTPEDLVRIQENPEKWFS